MSDTLVRLEAPQERIIKELTKSGVFRTKAETIRAAIMRLGEDYGLDGPMIIKQITDPRVIAKIQKIEAENKKASRKVLSAEEVRKKYPHLPLP